MNRLAAGLLIALVGSAPLLAQERDRSLERIGLALQRPLSIERGVAAPVEGAQPKTLGVFTLVSPALPGEVIRVSIPIGELVSRAYKGTAAVNRQRQVAAARRKVEADLEWFKQQHPASKQ